MYKTNIANKLLIYGIVLVALAGCRHPQQEQVEVPAPPDIEVSATAADTPYIISEVRRPDVKIHVKRGQALLMQTDGLTLTAADAAVQREADYSVTSLASGELPPLPQGMTNMTAAAAGYRLLPNGEHFLPYAELRVAYDPERLPEGYTPDDIYTSYYDTATQAWVRLERVGVDIANHEIVSLTTHFTDFVNELLKAPEMPETQAFVPTAMSDLEAVSPMDGLTMIQPPTANNNGTANVSHPLPIPAGRNGMQPNLALNYSSANGGGWLGVGWDIPVPSITLDTRWGVPRYNATYETEIYLLDGEQLITREADGTPRPMPHRTNRQTYRDSLGDTVQFYARFGDAHDSIIRHGDSPRDYWWEVTDRTGTTHYYGHYADSWRNTALPTTLCDDEGNIARWPICESRDPYGNTVRYYYDHATVKNRGAKGRQLYPDSISYTGHGDTDGYYTVVFCRKANSTTDIPVSCNNGFKEVTDQVLDHVYVKYGDSILTAWVFETENDYRTNYKNRLVSVTKIDSAANGIRNLLAGLCHCIRPDEDDDSVTSYGDGGGVGGGTITVYDSVNQKTDTVTITDTDTITDTTHYVPLGVMGVGYAGSTHTFTYYDAPAPDSMFSEPKTSTTIISDSIHGVMKTDPHGALELSRATALGVSHSSGWNAGGAATAGLDPVICMTSTSIGGNYTFSQSSSESLMALVDLDGDGLADKVFVRDGRLYYRKLVLNSDSTIAFANSAQEVPGASHFLQESGYSHTFGMQLAVGFSGSAGWTVSQSTTSTYFADVNGDGLVDLVDNGQVLFNSLDSDGTPSFSQYGTGDGEGTDSLTVTTSAMPCEGFIFDGAVSDSITCERVWVADTSFECGTDSARAYVLLYLAEADTMAESEPVGLEEDRVTVTRYHREWDCSYHDGLPVTEAVRVWIAPRDGEISLETFVGLLEDTSATRRAARHADGVDYSIQHTGGVTQAADTLAAEYNHILHTFHICETCYHPDSLYIYDSVFTVSQGDMLFFRLRSKKSRRFDDVYDSIRIQYVRHGGVFDSRSDFVLSGAQCFQAPVDGTYSIELFDYVDLSGLELKISVDDSVIPYQYPMQDSISKGSTVCFTLSSSEDFFDWGQVECRPYITFVPKTGAALYDTNVSDGVTTVDTVLFTDTVRGWVPCLIDIKHVGGDTIYDRTLLRRLFGPLYHGWGQFAYHSLDTGQDAEYIRVGKLVPPDMLVPGVSGSADTVGLRGTLHGGDTLSEDDLGRDSTFEAFQANHRGLYNPLSYSSYWVEMTPDVEHQAWVAYGRLNHVGRTCMSNALQVRWYSSRDSVSAATDVRMPESVIYDDAVPPPSADGKRAKAVHKTNTSLSGCFSVGAFGSGRSGSWGANVVTADYLDLNGDRYPDNVGPCFVQYSQQWGGIGKGRVLPPGMFKGSLSTTSSWGSSYCASPIRQDRMVCGSPGKALFTLDCEGGGSGSMGHDNASGSWIDINGDGLADFVTKDGKVYLNIGYGFLYEEGWGYGAVRSGVSGSVALNLGVPMRAELFNVCQGSIQAGAGFSSSYNQTTVMMTDVNGDGLPDIVARNVPDDIAGIASTLFGGTEVSTTVAFNMGNRLWSAPMPVNIGPFHASANNSESLNAGLTGGFTVSDFKVTVGLDGSPCHGSVNKDYFQLADVDADGLPDLVASTSENHLSVRYNRGGRTNLLRSVTNFAGAGFEIAYELSRPDYGQPSRSWQMARVTTHDTLNRRNGPATTVTEYAYAGPRYDRFERTSYGYDTVTVSHIDPATGNTYRRIRREYYTDNMLRRGRLKRELTYVDDSTLYIEKRHECTYARYADGGAVDVGSPCPDISYPNMEATFTTYYEGGTTPLLVVGEGMEYDRHHNVTRYTDMGDTADHEDGLVVEFQYFDGLRHNLIGLRKGYTVIPTDSADTMRRARYEYDFAHGRPTRQVLYNGTDSSVYDFEYDAAYGNLKTALLPENDSGGRMTYRYTYDGTVHAYPTRITDSYGDTMYSSYDYRFGRPLSVTDPTGGTMTYRYDFAGRLVSVSSPLNTSGTPSLVNKYHPTNYYHNGLNPQGYTFNESPTHHPYSVSMHYDDNGSLITATAVLTNGFGQAIQTKKGLRVGSADKMQVSGRVVVDAFGRTVEQYDPVTEPRTSHWGQYNTGYSAASLTTTAYDVLDRTTSTVCPLNVTTQAAYSIGNDQGGRRRFVTAVTDPNNNVTTQYADYEGRKVQVTDADNGITLMHYDNLGQLVSTTDPEGFSTTYDYDMLGRMTKRVHPDAGETRYNYDNAGNLVEEQNPLGQIFYDYTYYRVLNKRYYMTFSRLGIVQTLRDLPSALDLSKTL